MASHSAAVSADIPATASPGAYKWYVAVALALASAMSFMDRFVLALVNEPLRADLHVTDTQLGLLQGAGFVLLYCTCAIPLGWVADIANRRNLILAGMTVWSGATVAAAFACSFEMLLASRILVGMGEACLIPAGMSLLASYFGKQQLATATSIFAAGAYVGQGVVFMGGAAVLSLWTSQGGLHLGGVTFTAWQGVFLAAGLLAAPVLLMLLWVKEPVRPPEAVRITVADNVRALTEGLGYIFKHFRGYGMHFAAGSATSVMGYAGMSWTISLMERVHQVPVKTAGLVMGLSATVFGVLGSLAGGFLMDALIRRKAAGAPLIMLALGAILAASGAVGLCVVAVGKPFPWVAGSVALMIFASTITISATWGGVQLLTPDRYRGVAASVNMLLYTLFGFGIGPTMVGLLSDRGQGTPAALAHAVVVTELTFGAVVLLLALFGRKAYQSKMI